MTPAHVVTRLLTMDRREMWFRASTASRRAAGRVAYMARRPQWRRDALANALRDDHPSVLPAIACLHEGNWLGAHHALMHHFATRRPRFVLQPAARSERARTILAHHPGARAHAVRRGDRLAAGQFDLLGYRGLTFGNAAHPAHIDWRLDPVHQRQALQTYWSQVPYLEPRCGDHKVVWELNRHQSWLSLGRAYWLSDDRRYRDAFIAYLSSWMQSNPPLTGVNWSSMLEISLRALSWLWALHFFVHDGVDDVGAGELRRVTVDRRSVARARSATATRRAEPLALLQSQYPSARRSARPLRRGPRAARVSTRRELGTTRSRGAHRANLQADPCRRRPCGALDSLPSVHAGLLPAGARRSPA